jgi:hypothetical protein
MKAAEYLENITVSSSGGPFCGPHSRFVAANLEAWRGLGQAFFTVSPIFGLQRV